MRRVLLIGSCIAMLLACDKGQDTPAADAKQATADAEQAPADAKQPDATTPPADAKQPAAEAEPSACQTACDHRKSCGVPGADDVERCVEDCTLLADTLTAEALAEYSKGSCDEAKQGDVNFQTAAMCRRACRHRSSCLTDADATSCEAECAGLVMVTDQDPKAALTPYIDGGCDAVNSEEEGFQMAGSCLRACAKVVECGVRDELRGCIGECAQMIANGETNAANARALAGQDCDQVRATVPAKATPKVKAPTSIATATMSGNGCRSSGNQDCPYFSVCCRGSDYTRPGSGPGYCISPAICLMPTR